MKVFVSHSSLDQAVAEALQTLLNGTFGPDYIELVFSSDEEGGIPAGKDWLKWIKDNIKAADFAFVLVTPNSINSPWVMWEAGVATGVALGASEDQGVIVPIVIGVPKDKIPSPFNSVQGIRGEETGIAKLLRDIREIFIKQGAKFPPIDSSIKVNVPEFLKTVDGVIRESSEPVLSSIPSIFNANVLSGYWVSSYDFGKKRHADIAHITATSARSVRISNNPPTPCTEGHAANPYCNVIEAEVVNRHLVGHWKNVNDTRYFGSLHLAVEPSDNTMIGHYTSFNNDVKVGVGPWMWTRLNPKTMVNVDLENTTLRPAREIRDIIVRYRGTGQRLDLDLVVEHSD